MIIKYDFIIVFTILFVTNSSGQRSCESIGGECVKVFECTSAMKSLEMFRSHSLQRCGWNGLIEKVCCLDNARNGGVTTTISVSQSEEDGSIWNDTDDKQTNTTQATIPATSQTNVPRGDVRKSEAACARYAADVPFEINWHILGGEAAEVGEFPHMVALGYPDPNSLTALLWNCAGSLISEQWILSAAHCVVRVKPLRALLGVLNITEQSANRREYQITDIIIHPEYVRRAGRNDISLIKMDGTVTFSDAVRPACLYLKPDDPLALVITGWGKIYLGQDIRSDTLQKAKVIPVSLASCNGTYVSRLNRALNPGQLCAGPANPEIPTDSCPGDSGGPLQLLRQDNVYAVVGIISFGLTDCGGDAPSVYTRVHSYLDWIEGIVWP